MKSRQWFSSAQNWLMIVVFLMILYQLLYSPFIVRIFEPAIHRIIHLGFCFVVVYLAVLATMPKASTLPLRAKRVLIFLLVLVSIGITVQLVAIYPKAVGAFVLPPIEAMIAGNIGLLFTFIITWWRYGKTFPIVALLAFAYVIFSPYIFPEGLQAPQVGLARLFSWAGGDVASEWGVYGQYVGLMANYMWLLMIFGTFLQAFNGLRFIQKIGMVVSSRLASGPAMLCVVTSALMGMVTGVTAANIATVGSFTIPMMKKRGYSSEEAGAIEMAASNGGQIMPPIMGVTAFIMAEYIGVPYVKVAFVAIVPAILYFLCVGIYVQLRAKKRGWAPIPMEVNIKDALLDAPQFFVPFAVLIILLIEGYTLMFVATGSIVSVFVTSFIAHLLRKESRIDWKAAKNIIISGTVMAAEVTVVTGLLGALTAMIEMSGLGYMLGEFAIKISMGNQFLLLLFAAVVCLILGTGLPTIASYVLTATVLAAPIISLGVPVLLVHFFIFVYAVFANLTPPIGFGIIVAQRLAGGDYYKTAGEGLKATFIALVLPFLYIYTPAIMMQFQGLSAGTIFMHYAISVNLVMAVSPLLCGFGLSKLGIIDMILFSAASILPALSLLVIHSWVPALLGLVFCAGGYLIGYRRARVLQRAALAPRS